MIFFLIDAPEKRMNKNTRYKIFVEGVNGDIPVKEENTYYLAINIFCKFPKKSLQIDETKACDMGGH